MPTDNHLHTKKNLGLTLSTPGLGIFFILNLGLYSLLSFIQKDSLCWSQAQINTEWLNIQLQESICRSPKRVCPYMKAIFLILFVNSYCERLCTLQSVDMYYECTTVDSDCDCVLPSHNRGILLRPSLLTQCCSCWLLVVTESETRLSQAGQHS